ncbi:MAG: hypothetical protein LBR45_01070, partial [Bacteroidales bacterium]|nr:hypothetical protein [Bacteroidales bacterium]
MKTKNFFLLLSFFSVNAVFAQLPSAGGNAAPQNPVKWNYTVENVKDGEAVLVFKAKIAGDWHLYSQHLEAGGPLPTVFNFPSSKDFTRVGSISESPKPKEGVDDIFGTKIAYFGGNATFKQRIKINTQNDFKIKGTIDYQVCNEETCIPFTDIDFAFDVKVGAEIAAGEVAESDTMAVADVTETSEVTASNNTATVTTDNAINGNTEDAGAGVSWGFILTAVLMGLLAVLTPCVFPMIPMTVSFFIDTDSGAKGRSKGILKGLIFALSVTLIYTAIGGIVAITKSA